MASTERSGKNDLILFFRRNKNIISIYTKYPVCWCVYQLSIVVCSFASRSASFSRQNASHFPSVWIGRSLQKLLGIITARPSFRRIGIWSENQDGAIATVLNNTCPAPLIIVSKRFSQFVWRDQQTEVKDAMCVCVCVCVSVCVGLSLDWGAPVGVVKCWKSQLKSRSRLSLRLYGAVWIICLRNKLQDDWLYLSVKRFLCKQYTQVIFLLWSNCLISDLIYGTTNSIII